MSDISIRPAKREDLSAAGRVLFGVDPYIYPAAFGNEDAAAMAFPVLMGVARGVYSPEFTYVADDGKRIVGACCSFDSSARGAPYEDMALPVDVPETYSQVCVGYFDVLHKHAKDGCAYLNAICVDGSCRGHGVGSMLLRASIERWHGRPMLLDVLADNSAAFALYERFGFRRVSSSPGFAVAGTARPMVHSMLRDADA